MRLIFNIDYHTNYGEKLFVTGDLPELGNGDRSKALPLEHSGYGLNSASIEISPATSSVSYRYFVRHDDGTVREEWGADRTLRFDPLTAKASVTDHWQDQPADKPFYSQAFTRCICRRHHQEEPVRINPGTITLSISAPMILPGETLAISGSCKALGDWDPAKAVIMNHASFPVWTVQFPTAELAGKPIEYKFLVLRESDHTPLGWDECNNRTLEIAAEPDNDAIVITGLTFCNPRPRWRGAGVAIPVFSLRSEKDFGVGDFADLRLMADWAAATGQKMIQLLPINDTTMTRTWTDSYPYNAISCFALHPMYLRLQDMGQLSDRHEQARFDALARELNGLDTVDYERVNRAKDEFTRKLFDQQGEAEMTSPEFKKFIKNNTEWLKPYAAFCVLRDRYRTADMSAWEEYSVYDPDIIEKFISRHRHEIDYVYYIQYHLDKQLRDARDYAHSLGVAIKGDIPIGISRNSVDAWIHPELFNLDCSAGAPPDDFSIMGQNWGFPTYNWDVMARDGYAWWKQRFRKMAEYFDVYRIDHVLGFFRIWQIPLNALHGLLGYFNPAMPLSPDDMRYLFDFHFRPDIFTSPYIVDYEINEIFGDLADEVRSSYLTAIDGERYRLNDGFTTQRQVSDYFAANPLDQRAQRICEGLLRLIDDVLFIEDPYQEGRFHPRIAAQSTYVYRSLNDYEKWCFNRLYDDFFYRRHNDFWYGKAMEKLPPVIDATDMLCCAEDLGMIPACVPSVMSKLEILSLEIQRMPKDPSVEFADTWHYPYLSVCTTSTHDMAGIRQWWESDPAATQRYYNHILGRQGNAPYFVEPWICHQIVEMHLKSPSMLCILPLQDWLSTDGRMRREDPREEQINVPANPRHYWRYRMHLTLEKLYSDETFRTSVAGLVAQSGR